jgi:hypothetical protein
MVEIKVPRWHGWAAAVRSLAFVAAGLAVGAAPILLVQAVRHMVLPLLAAGLLLAVGLSAARYIKYTNLALRADGEGLKIIRGGETRTIAWGDISQIRDLRLSRTTALFDRQGCELLRVHSRTTGFQEFFDYVGKQVAAYAEMVGEPEALDASDKLFVRFTNASFCLLPVLGAFVIIFMALSGGHRDVILRFSGVTAEAWIETVDLPEDGHGEHTITYCFADAKGQAWRGQDVIPRTLLSPKLEEVAISYWERDPTVSRVTSQISDAPLLGFVMGGLFILSWLYSLVTGVLRGKRRTAAG